MIELEMVDSFIFWYDCSAKENNFLMCYESIFVSEFCVYLSQQFHGKCTECTFSHVGVIWWKDYLEWISRFKWSHQCNVQWDIFESVLWWHYWRSKSTMDMNCYIWVFTNLNLYLETFFIWSKNLLQLSKLVHTIEEWLLSTAYTVEVCTFTF